MIILSKTHLHNIQEHGKEAYPHECCGAMLGELKPDKKKQTTQIVRLENNWIESKTESRHRRFAVTADDYRQLEQKAKDANLILIGFYHTHPDHPAKPSETDLSYAWPFFSYIILSVKNGQPSDIFSYELDVDSNEFITETISIPESK